MTHNKNKDGLKMKAYLSTAAVSFGLLAGGLAQAQTVNYGLLQDIFGEPVTTSATGKPQRASEVPVSMEIITQKDIQQSGARDIPQLLQRYAGVEVSRPFFGRADVNIRGYNQPYANRLLVLVNGRQVLQDHFGQTLWEHLPIQLGEIRQIEVVRGPNSSLFGFNAESGVINIITYSPLMDDVDFVEAKAGTQNFKEVSGSLTEQFGDSVAVRVSGGYTEADGYDRDDRVNNTPSDDAYDDRNANVDVEWKMDDAAVVRFQANIASGRNDTLAPFFAIMSPSVDSRSAHVSYARQSDYGLWNVDVYHNSLDWVHNSILGPLDNDNDLTVAKVSNLFKVGADHAFRLAGEYRYNRLKGTLTSNSQFDYDLIAPSAMWDWQVSDKLAWTNSVRFDHVETDRRDAPTTGPYSGNRSVYSQTIDEYSYNSALVYKLDDSSRVRASAARGLHIPSLIELGSALSLGGPAYFAGDPRLETEINTTYELGYTRKLSEMASEVGANVFVQKLENVIAYDIAAGAPQLGFLNAGDSTSVGVELMAEGRFRDMLDWAANYTGQWVNDDARANVTTLDFEDRQATHMVSIYGGFDFMDKWRFDSDVNYVSSQDWTILGSSGNLYSEELEDYVVLNARLAYAVDEDKTLALSGYNLVDRHRETIGAVADPLLQNLGGTTLGRTVLLSFTSGF